MPRRTRRQVELPPRNQNNPLARAKSVVERFVDVVEGKFGGDILEAGAGLDEMAEMVGVEVLVVPDVFVENEERFVVPSRGNFPKQEDVWVMAMQDVRGTFFLENR